MNASTSTSTSAPKSTLIVKKRKVEVEKKIKAEKKKDIERDLEKQVKILEKNHVKTDYYTQFDKVAGPTLKAFEELGMNKQWKFYKNLDRYLILDESPYNLEVNVDMCYRLFFFKRNYLEKLEKEEAEEEETEEME